MGILKCSIKSNLYKIIHTKLLLVHTLLPLLAAVVFIGYYKVSVLQEFEQVKMYLQVLAILYPMTIALVITAVYEADLNAGEFQLFCMLERNKAWAHVGNLLALLILSGVAIFLAVGGFGVLFLAMSNQIYNVDFYVKAALLLFFVNAPGYILQYLICYTFGKGVSLGSGVVGLMLGPLMYLGLGDRIWKVVPYSYGIRMISYYLLKDKKETPFLSYIIRDYKTGGIIIGIITVICVGLFVVWGNVWQGDKITAD